MLAIIAVEFKMKKIKGEPEPELAIKTDEEWLWRPGFE